MITQLVSVTHAGLAYRRYLGRLRTHEGAFDTPLDREWVEVFRTKPSELCPPEEKQIHVKRRNT